MVNNGCSRGFGFVSFANKEAATRALTEMNGIVIHNKPLYVAVAMRKEDRKNQLDQQFNQRYNCNIAQAFACSHFFPRSVGLGPTDS